jgi:hypothetical protein
MYHEQGFLTLKQQLSPKGEPAQLVLQDVF